MVLFCLRANCLTDTPQKCQWGTSQLEYLGHLVGDGKVAVPEDRIQAI